MQMTCQALGSPQDPNGLHFTDRACASTRDAGVLIGYMCRSDPCQIDPNDQA